MSIEPKKELTTEEVHNKMSWEQVWKYYFPEFTSEEIDFFLWECTPYPFENKETLRLIYQKYLEDNLK